MIVNSISGYETSRDYDALFDMVQNQGVICILDYNRAGTRDVGRSTFSPHSGLIEISARGICYIWAELKSEFIEQCEKLNLEWLKPNSPARTAP